MKVLLIEDDPDSVRIAEEALSAWPIEVIACDTGKGGVARVAEGDIELVIVDGLLPDWQGMRVIETIKAMRARPVDPIDPKIVFLSAFFKDVRTFRKLTALGVDLVIHKPISPGDLRQKLSPLMPQEVKRARDEESEFAAAFAQMKAQYVEKLHHVWAPRLEELIELVRSGKNTSAIDELRMFSHKLHGTAKSYGQPQISEAAARLERQVEYQEIPRLLPEMQAFLALLRETRTESYRAESESRAAGPALLERTVLVLSDSPVAYKRLTDELYANDGFRLAQVHSDRSLESIEEVLPRIIELQPDLLIVDAMFHDLAEDRPAIEVLHELQLEIPILAFGEPAAELPPEIPSVPIAARRKQLLEQLQRPELRPFRGTRALICDEDVRASRQMRAPLTALGMTVERCTLAADVLAHASVPPGAQFFDGEMEFVRPDVILLDVEFMGQTGIALARQLRGESPTSPPVICSSTHTTREERAQVYRAGAVGYVLKPIANEQLMHAVAQVLRRQRMIRMLLARLPER